MTKISEILPGYNCGGCGHRQCRDYADEISKTGDISKCSYLELDRFSDTNTEIKEALSTHVVEGSFEETIPHCKGCGEGISAFKGNSGYKVDFSLGAIPGEPSCREELYPFARPTDLEPGDVLRYRPLGCPVIHFAKVVKFNKGIATVHLAGPHQLLGVEDFQYKDMGICMVTGFEGSVNKGRIPDVGETVKFLPSHCRMRQVHSGVIVHSEGNRLRIEGIDLKVWR